MRRENQVRGADVTPPGLPTCHTCTASSFPFPHLLPLSLCLSVPTYLSSLCTPFQLATSHFHYVLHVFPLCYVIAPPPCTLFPITLSLPIFLQFTFPLSPPLLPPLQCYPASRSLSLPFSFCPPFFPLALSTCSSTHTLAPHLSLAISLFLTSLTLPISLSSHFVCPFP